jgi:hypothetical protein
LGQLSAKLYCFVATAGDYSMTVSRQYRAFSEDLRGKIISKKNAAIFGEAKAKP